MDDNTKRLTLRLPKEVYDSVKALAVKSDNSLNGQIVNMLRRASDMKLAPLPHFWELPLEKRVDILLTGFAEYVTEELP